MRRSTPIPAWFVLLGLMAAASVAFALSAFPRAFPLVQVDLRMDRGRALGAASELAERNGWGPEGYRSAASFGDADPSARRFLELEGGVAGPDVPAALEERGLSAYLWRVRHVREQDATELEVRFTPAGTPYGFRLTLPEDAPGPDLPVEEARALAEAAATEWGFDAASYTQVEASRTLRPGGRGDHTFVYQRRGSAVAGAEARLRLELAGDRLSAVEPHLRVPEAFLRRFEEMRSVNQRIAFAASAFFLLVLVLGGCGIGIFVLIRADAVAWRPALLLGGVIALLAALSTVNGLPLAWMEYDSALPESLFLLTSGVLIPIGILAGGTLFFAWVIASAEGLGRLAFPSHPAFWRIWSRSAGGTPEVGGRTLAGYMVAAIELGWVVGFYLLAGRLEGWWTPADALVSPDLLATYQPWLQAVALSLMAGVWEESVFRAVPLAGAALLGRRFGRPALWIGVTLLVQAVAFGAAHADYPQQPAYARVVELAPSALLWGLIYLRYGLLPVILVHSLYNLTLFSLPLFALSAPGIGLHRAVVVAVGLLPLVVVAWRRLQHGQVGPLMEEDRNGGWRPADPESRAPGESREPAPVGRGAPERVPLHRPLPTWTVPAAAFLGLILWLGGRPPLPDELRLAGERNRATEQARETLRARGVNPDEWTVTVRPSSPWGQEATFLRLEGGREAVDVALRAGHLPSPAWVVRLARFRGPVEERAEEWGVEVEGERVRRVVHRLPEGRPGGRLDEAAARALAEDALRREGLSPPSLRPVSAQARDLPARQDWTLVWADPSVEVPAGGEARITVRISGDEVADVVRLIHVPESWERERRERNSRFLLTLVPLFMLVGGGALLAALGGLLGVARRTIPGRPVAIVAAALLAIALLHALNGLPGINATASTTASLPDQRVQGLVGALLGNVFLAGFLALGLGFAARHAGTEERGSTLSRNAGGALGLLLAGVWTVAGRLLPPQPIPTPDVTGAGDVVPWLAELGTLPGSFAALLGLLLLGTALVQRLDGGRNPRWTPAILVVGGALLLPGGPDTPLFARALLGAATGGLLLVVARSAGVAGASFLPALAAGLVLPDAMTPMLDRPFPGAAVGGVVGVSLLLVLGRGAVLFLESVSVSGGRPAPAPPGGDPRATHASDSAP